MPQGRAVGSALVIGVGGLVGAHVRRALGRDAVTGTYHRAPVDEAMRLDLRDAAAVRAVIRDAHADAIVLAAADAWVERCERQPDETRRVNVDAARTVADCARDAGAAFVVFSSEYVFDGTAGAYAEHDAVAPINEYGRQKVELERIARGVPQHLICRTSGVFGHEAARKNFVYQLVGTLTSGRPFRVAGDQLITPTYAPDLAAAVVALLRGGQWGTYHVVGPRIVGRADLARSVARAFHLDPALIEERTTAEIGYAAPRPLRAGLKDDKLRAALGSRLRDPEDALADMYARELETSSLQGASQS